LVALAHKSQDLRGGEKFGKNKMTKQRNFFRLTLVISVLVAIILPLAMAGKPIDWDRFFLIMALSFSLTWAIY
jgi:hypothetical protein